MPVVVAPGVSCPRRGTTRFHYEPDVTGIGNDRISVM